MDTDHSSLLPGSRGGTVDVGQLVHRALLFVLLLLPIFFSGVSAGRGTSAQTGTITFSGRVIDQHAPFVLGSLVTVRAVVVGRSNACIEVRVLATESSHHGLLWLCASRVHGANRSPAVGETIMTRARITRVEAAIPYSDSFILLQAN